MQLDETLKQYREKWAGLPDRRKANNNLRYTMADGVMAAFSVFFMQSPSFLAHQQEMAQRKGRSNAVSLFKMAEIPSDNQIRNLLDGLQPSHFAEDYEWLHEQVKQAGQLEQFVDHGGTYLIAYGWVDVLQFKEGAMP